MPGAPGPDGRHDDLDADQLEGLALLVPDDPRSLDADRDAYMRELQERRRADRTHAAGGRSFLLRALGGRGGPGLAGPALLVLLVVVGLVGSTLSVFGSGAVADRTTTPLATATTAPAGAVGGLLPAAVVTVRGSKVQLREARPAVLVMVPTTCPDCATTLAHLRAQAAEYQLPLVLVGPASQQGQLRELDDTALGGGIAIVSDDGDVMRSTYTPTGITAVLVRDDGVVAQVSPGLTPTSSLETALVQLDGRTAPTA